MKHAHVFLAAALAATPALGQDVKVLLCTAETHLDLNSTSLEPVPSDDTYTWELRYDGPDLVALAAPFDCLEGTTEYSIGNTVLALSCKQGVSDAVSINLSAEIDRYSQNFVVSGVGENTENPLANTALWTQSGTCELARRKF